MKGNPKNAFFGGEGGLDFYKKIAENISKSLDTDGQLILQTSQSNASDVFNLFANYFQKIGAYNHDEDGAILVASKLRDSVKVEKH